MNPDYARYDVSDLEAAELAMLGRLLERRGVPHAIDRGVLLVFAADERIVDDAIAEVEDAARCARC
jgi:hypothetical protein